MSDSIDAVASMTTDNASPFAVLRNVVRQASRGLVDLRHGCRRPQDGGCPLVPPDASRYGANFTVAQPLAGMANCSFLPPIATT
jgi:hypothetical protein